MAVLGYTCLGTNDYDRALAFYDQLFGAMGGQRLMPGPAGMIYALESGAAVFIVRPHDGGPAHPGNGNMLAFRVAEKEQVAVIHALALSLGGTCEGKPGPRGAFGDFAYFRDLDGNKLAVFHREKRAS